MATPVWDQLHLKFASQVRDAVSAANIAGAELEVADRDSYLNLAYSEYVRLVATYNPKSLNRLLPELFAVLPVNHVAGVITLPADFGYFIDLSQSGSILTKKEVDEWQAYIGSTTVQSPPDLKNIIYVLKDNILIRPLTASPSFDLSYLQFPQVITQGGSVDLNLSNKNWDTIVGLAKVAYYRDKQEFDIAASWEQTAIVNSPFKIGEIKK
jgi:hypothetical protein